MLVQVTPEATKVMIKDTKKVINESRRTYRALNTQQGMSWLLRYLSSR